MNKISKDSRGKYQLEEVSVSAGNKINKKKLAVLIGGVTVTVSAIFGAGVLSHKYLFSSDQPVRVSSRNLADPLPQGYTSIFEFPNRPEKADVINKLAANGNNADLLGNVRHVIEAARSTNYATVLILDRFLKKIDQAAAVKGEVTDDDLNRATEAAVRSLNRMAASARQVSAAQLPAIEPLSSASSVSKSVIPDSITPDASVAVSAVDAQKPVALKDVVKMAPEAKVAEISSAPEKSNPEKAHPEKVHAEQTLTEKFSAFQSRKDALRKAKLLKRIDKKKKAHAPAKSVVKKIRRKNWVIAEGESMMYRVRWGESLALIAKKFYGDPLKYPVIMAANTSKLRNPTKIRKGMRLIIPGVKKIEPVSVSLAD